MENNLEPLNKYYFDIYVEQTAWIHFKEEILAESLEKAREEVELIVQETSLDEYTYELVEQNIKLEKVEEC